MRYAPLCLARLLLLGWIVAGNASVPLALADAQFDWPHWRGPEFNGISREKNLPEKWSPDGENLVWKNDELGGRSTPIVMNGKLYTLVRHRPATVHEGEKVVCVDIATGKVLWENVFNAFLTDVPDTRLGWSSVVGDPASGHIFALGVCGHFQCIDSQTGATVWARSMSEEFGMLSTYGGRTNFPMVHEHLVIIGGVIIGWGEMARPAHRVIAFDKRNGQPVWFQSTRPLPEDTTYSTPVAGVVNGQAQLVLGAGDGSLYGIQPRTGKTIWNYDVSPRGINTTPVIHNGQVVCGHSEENIDDTRMGALFSVDPTKTGNLTKTGELWRNKEQFIGRCAPLVVDDRIYAIDDGGIFFIVDLKTGKLVGKTKIGTMGRGSPVYGDGKIYCCDGTGKWFTFAPSEGGVKKLHQMRLDVEVNASPIISHGKIFLSTETSLMCVGLPDQSPSADPRPEPAKETPVADDPKPATIVLAPVESLMKPGQKQQFKVFVYNAEGQYLETADPAKVKFASTGAGEFASPGKFASAADKGQYATIISAELDGMKSAARVRVVPDLPWKYEFSDGVVPITGVGMRYRHIGLDFDLREKLRAENPLAAKAYIYLTTQFTNFEKPVAKFDDSTPAQGWTVMRRYLGLLEKATDLETSKAALDPVFELLKRERLIAEWSWADEPAPVGVQLTVKRGDRGVEGNGVMCKITTIPKGTRSQGWLGHIDSKNYEMTVDALGATVEYGAGDPSSKKPDIGVINQRYRFEMLGAAQELKLYSWYPHDQKYFKVPFAWDTETWYRLKFRVTTETKDGETVSHLQGKAWKRDEPEPEAWSIEWTDSPGNWSGSPGLAGNAKDAEIFFDNLVVAPRE